MKPAKKPEILLKVGVVGVGPPPTPNGQHGAQDPVNAPRAQQVFGIDQTFQNSIHYADRLGHGKRSIDFPKHNIYDISKS